MRSYYAHLQTTSPQVSGVISKPIYRSSAIFPVFQSDSISSRLLFLGYWFLKRNIKEIAAVVTLRSNAGEVLTRRLLSINEAKAYRIELRELLAEENSFPTASSFEGTLEIEFFSISNLFFPYPAVVINYYGPHFSSVVHTAQRIYNDFDDMQKNSQSNVPESGFNVHVSENCEPFIGMINGTETQEEGLLTLQFYNRNGEILNFSKPLGVLHPYENRVIYPAREVDLNRFLEGKEGACKATFNVKGIFPRLLVGNALKAPEAFSITHTYYDCSNTATQNDYWKAPDPEWHMASLMLPVLFKEMNFTNVYFYPIYSPSTLLIDIEIYSPEGKLLGSKANVLSIESPREGFDVIPLNEILQELHIEPSENLAARVIARPSPGSPFPSRVKIGLDIGHNAKGLPCNICMNLQPFNPQAENKPSSFKWLPILADQPHSSIWLMNSSPKKEYDKTASLEIIFYREEDDSSLTRSIELPPNGFLIIAPNEDPELKEFLKRKVGWAVVKTNNSFLTTYYFAEHLSSGVVGGDHGF